MIADFYDTFEETPDKGSDIPQEVLDILSKEHFLLHLCTIAMKMETMLLVQDLIIHPKQYC